MVAEIKKEATLSNTVLCNLEERAVIVCDAIMRKVCEGEGWACADLLLSLQRVSFVLRWISG